MPDLFVILDACAPPGAFAAAGTRPPVVAALLALDAVRNIALCPPAIVCRERDVARARGALLVSGDEDGLVLALPAELAESGRARLARHFARLHQPQAALLFTPATPQALKQALKTEAWQVPAPDPALTGLGFERLQKGAMIPEDALWAAIAAPRQQESETT